MKSDLNELLRNRKTNSPTHRPSLIADRNSWRLLRNCAESDFEKEVSLLFLLSCKQDIHKVNFYFYDDFDVCIHCPMSMKRLDISSFLNE